MASELPPVPFLDPRTGDIALAWRDILEDHGISTGTSAAWVDIDFSPSNLADIQTRAHSALQGIGEADETSVDTTKNKHVSNNQLKVLYDDVDGLEAKFTVTSKTSTFTAGDIMIVLVDASAGDVVVNLPTVASGIANLARYIFKKIDSTVNLVTVNPSGAETIDGEATMIINTQYDAMQIIPFGTEWGIV